MDELALNAAMDRYACGDARAFPEIDRALRPRLLAFLTRMTGAPALADDLTQETFLRLHRARATFSKAGAVLPWAYAIARNVYIDHVRSARLRRAERLPSDPGAEPADRAMGDAEGRAIASETARAVERVLAAIPQAQREAFVLLRYEGLTVQDAAAVLGATETAVKLRAFRAYEALRAELGLGAKGALAATRSPEPQIEAHRRAPDEKSAPAPDPAKPARGSGRRSPQGPANAGSRPTQRTRSGGADGS
jgi:RNA polymerase sigma-70 factor, ECF subfamily